MIASGPLVTPMTDRASYHADESLARFAAEFQPAQRTLPFMLARQADRHGDRVLFRTGETAWTFRQTREVAAGMAVRVCRITSS